MNKNKYKTLAFLLFQIKFPALQDSEGLFTCVIFTAILGAIFSAISMTRKIRTCEQPAILLRFSKFTSPQYCTCFEHA